MLAEHLPQLLIAWSIQWVAILSPGPAVAIILGLGASQGRRPALIFCAGLTGSSLIWSTATVLGLAALFAQMADLILIVRYIGAAYMAFLAYKAFRAAITPPALTLAAQPERPWHRYALSGFLVQVTNPKAIFFWLAIAAIGGIGVAPWPIVALFVAVAMVNTFVGHAAYAVLLSSTPVRNAYQRARRWVEATLGVLFTGFALRLAMERS